MRRALMTAGWARPTALAIRLGDRAYAAPAPKRRILRDIARSRTRGGDSEPSLSQMLKRANADFFRDGGGPLFPGTFVALPLSRTPRKPLDFARYHWIRFRSWLGCTVLLLGLKLKSMPSWRTAPRWKMGRARIAPTAKALYREMLEAFAAGDQPTLRRLCSASFAAKLCTAVDRRNPREGVRFDLVRYTRPLFYPRLLSHRVGQTNPFDDRIMSEQAVVAIASLQQASRYDTATGEMVPGSLKLQDKLEYVVLSRDLDQETFETTSWRIWGTTSATTLEHYLRDNEAYTKEQHSRWGLDRQSASKPKGQ